jgi:hypothetical protein
MEERNKNPHIKNLDLLKNLYPAMRDSGELSFEQWHKQAEEKLLELLGLPFEKCDPLLEIEYDKECNGYREIRFTFQSEENYFVPCHLLVPKKSENPLPVFICLQGHSNGMHVSMNRRKFEGETDASAGDRDFAVQAIKEGFCALVLEQRNLGECGGVPGKTNCYIPSMTNILMGRTTIGERVWDISRAIDILENNFQRIADCEKIACLGNSGGGTAAYYAACLEKRIKLAVPSCSVCTFKTSIAAMEHCACNFVPGIAKYFDMGDLGGLIAPRKLAVVAGTNDEIFPKPGVCEAYEFIENAYKRAGAPDNCRLVFGSGGHRFYAADSWPVIRSLIPDWYK